MGRRAGFLSPGFFIALTSLSLGEIVKVTSSEAQIYSSEKWIALPASAQGKHFMVYGARQGLYLIQLSAKKDTYAWVRAQDVEVDWGQAKVRTATVSSMPNVNTLKLTDGTLIQFRRILVPMEDSALTRQTEAWLKKYLVGKEVTLEYDAQVTENERGYEVAYVYVGGAFVNRTLVEHGRAKVPLSDKPGRYDAVFAFHARKAMEARIGIWAAGEQKKEQEKQGGQETGAGGESGSTTGDPGKEEQRQPPRKLTPADLARWKQMLRTEIKVANECEKEEYVTAVYTDGSKDRATEFTWTKTIEISVTNGWQRPLKGLKAKYEIFGKVGKTSKNVFVAKTAEIAGIDLKANETRRLVGEPVQFEAIDSRETGWQGNKYYGYRVRFYYRGTLVKVVALPEPLADWEED